ncbi:MAG: hypothetical protein MUE97_05460 [Phycisphaerales bacterium]|jgi:hypothetical protein|nr:hypothetical protein [Phycisphaerales bacterium]
MLRKRGAPVLVELLKKSPSSTTGPVSDVAPYATSNIPRIPTTTGNLAESASWAPAARIKQRSTMIIALVVSAAIVLIVIAAVIGRAVGQKSTDQQWADRVGGGGGGGGSGVAPSGGRGANDGLGGAGTPGGPGSTIPLIDQPAVVGPTPGPTSGTGPGPGPGRAGGGGGGGGATVTTALQPGWNYLVVATLPWKEAVQTAQFLAQSGYPAKVVPRNRVDPSQAEAKNTSCEVVLLAGFAPGEFSDARRERETLVTRIKALGRTWRAENRRAPSDFSDAFWKKF